MDDMEAFIAILVLCLLALGIRGIFKDAQYNSRTAERMAKDGYAAYRLPGSTDVYWYKPASDPTNIGLKGF